MLWCAKNYTNTFDDVVHHENIINNLKKYKYANLLNTLFYGTKGCGKKSIVYAFLNHLITTHFNINTSDICIITKEIKCKTCFR